jgi:hypothetical protein
MRQFEQDWLELGRRVACSLHYQHPRNLRLLQAAQAEPAGTPSVVVVVVDDMGVGAASAFGGPCPIPTAERLG